MIHMNFPNLSFSWINLFFWKPIAWKSYIKSAFEKSEKEINEKFVSLQTDKGLKFLNTYMTEKGYYFTTRDKGMFLKESQSYEKLKDLFNVIANFWLPFKNDFSL